MRQEPAVPPQPCRHRHRRLIHQIDPERVAHDAQIRLRRGLITGHRHMVPIDPPQVHPVRRGRGHHRIGPARRPRHHRVEQRAVHDPDPGRLQRRRQPRRPARDPLGDPLQALGAVPHRIRRGDHRRQHLRRADVARRLLPTNMLLPRLQRQPQRHRAVRVPRHPDQPARQLPPQLIAHRHETRMRATEPHRHPEPLRRPHRDIGTELPGRHQQRQRQQIGRHRHPRPGRMRRLHHTGPVPHRTISARILQQHPEHALRQLLDRAVGHDQLDAHRLRPRPQHRERLRQHPRIDHEHLAGAPRRRTPRQQHRLGRRARLVQQARPRHRQARQIGDHRLEVQQRLQTPLADLRLIRRIRRIPRRILQHIAPDHRRHARPVIPQPDHRPHRPVLRRDRPQLRLRLGLRHRRRQAHRPRGTNQIRHAGVHQRLKARKPHRLEHRVAISGTGTDMAIRERTVSHEGPPVTVDGSCSPLVCHQPLNLSTGSRAANPEQSWYLRV